MTGRIGSGLVCVAVQEETSEAALVAAHKAEVLADVIEIRLDGMDDPDISLFMKELKTDLLFTNRPVWEGGRFEGDESERVDILLEAVEKEAAYVDLELKSQGSSLESLLEAKRSSSTRLILSSHNFSSTPKVSQLLDIVRAMNARGADIGKIVTTAQGYQDVLDVLSLQGEAALLDMDLIAFCMGRAGVISRVATLDLGGFMTYCAADESGGTAPGQFPVEKLRQIQELLK